MRWGVLNCVVMALLGVRHAHKGIESTQKAVLYTSYPCCLGISRVKALKGDLMMQGWLVKCSAADCAPSVGMVHTRVQSVHVHASLYLLPEDYSNGTHEAGVIRTIQV